MPINDINLGTASDNGTGDDARTAGAKINANFEYIESLINSKPLSTLEQFTATEGQTEFTLTNSPNNVDVYVDGGYKIEGLQYTLTGSTVTLTNPVYAGSIITIRKF